MAENYKEELIYIKIKIFKTFFLSIRITIKNKKP